MWRPAADPARRAGFTLIETLIALVVASLFLAALAPALSSAWRSARSPMDVVSAVVLARAAVIGAPDEAFSAARRQGFSVTRSSQALDLVVDTSMLAPAPPTAVTPLNPSATPAGMRLAEPKALIDASSRPSLVLHRIAVVVKTPAGRHLRLDGIRADDAPP